MGNSMKKDKQPKSYSDEQWAQFLTLRDGFIEKLKEEDEALINKALNEHPDNQVPADDENPAQTRIQWDDCPLKMTASYYANDRLEITKMPVYEPDELLLIING